jgi:RHS repeat-associated protein
VYFDDITVKHYTGPLLQEQSYYPFGVEMAAISDKAMNKLSSAYKFNGGDEMEESISMYSTFYRGYDQQLGRFMGVDMASEQTSGMSVYQFGANNPIFFNDPLGDKLSAFEAINELLNNPKYSNGGSWDAASGEIDAFSSQDAAFGAGVWMMNSGGGGGWGGGLGWAGSFSEALNSFNGGRITPDMVAAYYTREWSTSGRYNVTADYARGDKRGQGFVVGWNFDTGRGNGGLTDVGIGGMYISNATATVLMSGMTNNLFSQFGQSDKESNKFSENIFQANEWVHKTLTTLGGQIYLLPETTAPSVILKATEKVLPTLERGVVTLTAVSNFYHGGKDISDKRWGDAVYELGKGGVTVGLIIFCPEGLLFWAIESWIGDEIRDQIEGDQ